MTAAAAAATEPAAFIDRAGELVVPGACDALPPLLNPFILIEPPHIVEGVCLLHVAVPVHVRADVVKGRRGEAANDGLGHCPLTACGLRIRPVHMYMHEAARARGRGVGGGGGRAGDPSTVWQGRIADATCRTCRRIAMAVWREAPPSMRDRPLLWWNAARETAPQNAALESFAAETGRHGTA